MSNLERVQEWMEEAGADRIRVSGVNLVSTCPFHGDQRPSFAFDFERGIYVCYSANCGETGNVYTFLTAALGRSAQEALRSIRFFQF